MITSKAFEKWSLDQKTKFVLAFKKEYNEAHGTNFELTEDSLKDNQDYDFSLRQKNGRILKVQHTLDVANVAVKVRLKLAEPVIENLKKRLNLKDMLVDINIYNPPCKQEQKKLVHLLEVLIRAKSRNQPSLFTYDKEDEHYLKEIVRWVDHLVIRRVVSSKVIFLTGSGKLENCAELSDDDRVDMALGRKEEKYSNPEDLVIIIHLDSPLFDSLEFNDSLPTIQSQQSSRRFQEIWVYEKSIGFIRI